MKQKVLSGVLGIFMLLVMFVPSIGATTKSFNWSFTMDLYAVYGNKNGEYHDLPAGDISVDGNIWTYAKSKTANATPLKVSVALWRNTLGFNTLVSSKVVTPSTVFESKKPVTNV